MRLSEKQLNEIVSSIKTPKLERKRKPEPPRASEDRVVTLLELPKKPTEAVIQDATTHNSALAQRLREETAEQRRQRAYAKELTQYHAEGRDPRVTYQRELDRWWQSKLDPEAALDDGYDYSTGFKERRYKATCHRGPGDPDWGL